MIRAAPRGARRVLAPFAVLAILAGLVVRAGAHGFGQRFDLPVPLNLYLIGSAATVAFSFVVIALFVRGGTELLAYPRFDLLPTRAGGLLANRATRLAIRTFSVVVFVVALLAGFQGIQDPARNVLPTLVWIIWWTGFAYVSALLGDVWALVNPWKILYGWAEGLQRRWRPDGRLGLGLAYPQWLGVWPAFALFLAFVWGELVWETNAIPANLAGAAFLYSLVTWAGMLVFGRHAWLRGGEAFTVAFGLLARFSPSEVRVVDRSACAACSSHDCRHGDGHCVDCYECFELAESSLRQWNLRPWSVGLLTREPISTSRTAFVLLLLATVSFDGFMATPLWNDTYELVTTSDAMMPFLHRLNMMGMSVEAIVSTMGLLAAPLLFVGIYLVFALLMMLGAGSSREGPAAGYSPGLLASYFVLSLIPIAIAYHLAHYLSYLLIAGQLVIPLVSDPFGFDWNLFGTAGYRVDVGIIGARFVWYTSVGAVVAGHIIAVYLAHALALRGFERRRSALGSQVPMLVLMVFYTFASLWILSQPIVE